MSQISKYDVHKVEIFVEYLKTVPIMRIAPKPLLMPSFAKGVRYFIPTSHTPFEVLKSTYEMAIGSKT